jgi:mono/diheme cytochrome c family protein
MNKVYRKITSLIGVAITCVVVASCTSDPNSPGHEYMPDMYRSPAIEPYVDYGEVRGLIHTDLNESLSAMTPPIFTVPYYGTDSAEVSIMLPYQRKATMAFAKTQGLYDEDLLQSDDPDSEYNAAAADINPIILTADNKDEIFAKGKTIYASKCAHCHGEKGDGDGPMVKSGAFSGAANFLVLDIPEGKMFYSIYYGKGMMGSHRSIINKKDIWTVIHYIKKLQNANYGGVAADVTVSDTTQTVK